MIFKIKNFLTLFVFSLGIFFYYYGYKNINYDKFKNNSFKIDSKIIDHTSEVQDNSIILEKKTNTNNSNEKAIKYENYEEFIVKVKQNQTFSNILQDYLTSNEKIFKIINEIEKFYNLKNLKAGQDIFFYNNSISKKLEKIILPIEKTVNLNININDKINVDKIILKTKTEKHSKEYSIINSLYADGIENKIPNQILSNLIKIYSFDLDFQRDIKKNTKVSISYESLDIENRSNKYFGDINYALIEIGKNKLEYFKFITDDGFIDYFNRKGENVKKSILKTPLDGAKLSSGFGMRKHPISGFNKMHKGVDFAAPIGTPVYAGGNGTIEFIGRNGGYGKFIKIRHNNEYKTAYAHLSGYKKGLHKGSRVNQGDVIGYVGNTGKSTGPHLHYEILFQNKQINPLKLKLPSGKILKGEELKRFILEMNKIYANHLNLLYE